MNGLHNVENYKTINTISASLCIYTKTHIIQDKYYQYLFLRAAVYYNIILTLFIPQIF